jgi:hypothetical protein
VTTPSEQQSSCCGTCAAVCRCSVADAFFKQDVQRLLSHGPFYVMKHLAPPFSRCVACDHHPRQRGVVCLQGGCSHTNGFLSLKKKLFFLVNLVACLQRVRWGEKGLSSGIFSVVFD